jgi:GNAT superfamily N-acetyltransferase
MDTQPSARRSLETDVTGDGYAIRRATREELAQLETIERAAATLFLTTRYAWLAEKGDSLPPAFLEKQQQEGLVWVVACDDLPVGFAVIHHSIDGQPFLEEMSIEPDHTRRRLGARLLETICDHARTSGASYIALTTFEDVPWNAPFYERHGFRRLSDEELPDGLRRRLTLELELYPGISRTAMRRDL